MKTIKLLAALSLLSLSFFAHPLGASENCDTRYYRHLVYNHGSPNVPYIGIYDISKDEAASAQHYEFKYDDNGKLTEIINYNAETWRNHPLTHLGSYRTTFQYVGNKEIREFYDKDGGRVKNLRNVYKEVYSLNEDGFKFSLEFYDLDDKPVESNWNISRYSWEKRGDLIIERRYNLKGELMPLSPYFNFHISGIKYDSAGHFQAHYNLNDALEVVNNENGIACYKDTYSKSGNHLGLAYYDKNDILTPSPWQSAMGRLCYDSEGNVTSLEFVDKDGVVVSRETYNYDASGLLIQKTN